MEKLFNARWWDYSDISFNINGRVCLHNSVLFGLLGMLLLYFINPAIETAILPLPQNLIIIFSVSLLLVFITDNIISFNIISKVKSTTTLILKDSTEEITEKVKEVLNKHSVLTRRLISAFPDLKTIIVKKTEKIKEQIQHTLDKGT